MASHDGLTEEQQQRLELSRKMARLDKAEEEGRLAELEDRLQQAEEEIDALVVERDQALDDVDDARANMTKAAEFGSILVGQNRDLQEDLDAKTRELEEAQEAQEEFKQDTHALEMERDKLKR